MTRKITSVERETQISLQVKGIPKNEYVDERDFTTLTFSVKDPVTGETLKEYSFKESEFNEKSYEDKKKFKNLEKISIFDEKAYKKESKKQSKIKETYLIEFENTYHELLEEKGITEQIHSMFEGIMNTVKDNFDFDGFGGDSTEYQIIFEEEIIDTIKSNL
jgi:hypothetical protein